MGNVISRDELSKIVHDLRAEGKKIVTTNGCFDILHVGHVQILNGAKTLGDVLIVGLNSDASVQRFKGADRPVVCEADRAVVLSNLRAVDYVTIFDEDNPVEFLKVVRPDIHVKGKDYVGKKLAEQEIVESLGGKVELLDLVPGKSTTSLIGKIKTL